MFWKTRAEDLDRFSFPNTFSPKRTNTLSLVQQGKLNTCYLAVDVHVNAGRGDQVAIYYDSPVTDTKKSYTYNQLLDEVSRVAVH
ncbi:MAG: hypothetical protein R3B47_12190 [Bacteroidia bacterium]